MYKKEFDLLKEIPHFLVFYGDNFFLDIYEKKLIEKFKNENILKLYYDEVEFEKAKSFLRENSLFGGKNILIIKTDKLGNLKELKKYAKENYCFIFYMGNKKLDLEKNEFVRFFKPTFREIMEHINFLCEREKVNLSFEAKEFLAKSVDALFLENEIKKLANFKKDISLNDVKNLVFLYKEESFEELFVKILNGEDFFDELNLMLEKVDFKRIIPLFINYLTTLYEYHLFIKTTGKSTLKDLLGYQLPLDIEKQRISMAIKLKEKDYKNLLDFLLRKELLMRNSLKEKEAIFWEVMIYLRNYHSF